MVRHAASKLAIKSVKQLLLLASVVTFGFGQSSGVQMFSTNEFGMDVASGAINFSIPLRAKPAGPNPASASLAGTSSFQISPNGYISARPFLGGATPGGPLGSVVLYSRGSCNAGFYDEMSITGVVDSSLTLHPILGFTVSPPGTCGFPPSGVGTARDGSGYTIAANASNGYHIDVFDSRGNHASTTTSNNFLGIASMTSASNTDGVAISQNGTSITDALSSISMISGPIGTLTTVWKTFSGTDTYQYTDSTGNLQQYSVTKTTPYIVRTNFNCPGTSGSGPLDTGPSTNYLPANIILPGSNGQYTLTYEATPGYAADVTGRITSITNPSGGSISYGYSGGSTGHGFNCWNGPFSATAVTVTTNDNNGNVGVWTYTTNVTQYNQSNFTVTRTGPPTPLSPNGDQVVYSFNGEFITQKKVYQGTATGTPLLTVLYCYNGNFSSCAAPTTNVALPITEVDSYTTPNNGINKRTKVLYDQTYGNVTYSSQYDYGASTPTAQQYFYYGQSWNGSSCTPYPSGSYINNTPCFSKTTDGSGAILAQTKTTYGNTGHPTSVSKWVSGSKWLTTSNVFNPNGTLASVTGPNNALTQYSNFACNGLLAQTTTLPLSSVGSTSEIWDCNGGVVTSSTDANGKITTFSFNDVMYRQSSTGNPDGGNTSFTYNTGTSLPWTTTTTLTLNSAGTTASTTNVMDGFGRTVQTYGTDPQSPSDYRYANTIYNSLGQISSVTNPFFTTGDATYGITSYAYDALGRKIQTTNPDSTTRTWTYLQRAMKTIDEAGVTEISQVDGLGRLVSVCQVTNVTQANGATPATCAQDITGMGFLVSYGYDAEGRLTSVSQSAQTRSFQFDGLSRLTQEINPESGSVNYTYDAPGQEADPYTRVVPRANQTGSATTTTTYAYDKMHRLIGASYDDGTPSASYAYDVATEMGATLANPKGRMVYAASNNSAAAISYDAVGRTADTWSCTPYNCGTSSYHLGLTYDYVGDLLTFTDSTTFSNRAVPVTYSYSYDSGPHLVGMSSSYTGTNYPATLYTVNSLNALGAVTKATLGNGIVRVAADDNRGRIASLADTRGSTTTYSFSLGYLPNSTINTANDFLEGNWTYTYDGFRRLSTASETGQSFAYQYDQFGNRWGTNSSCSSANPSACQFTFNVNNRITNGGFTYDAAGNVTYDGTYSYVYDAEGRVTNVKQGTTQIASYSYDALGHRTHQVVGTTSYEFLFDTAGRAYEEIIGNTAKETELYAGKSHVGVYANGTTYFSHENWLGTEVRHTLPGGSNTSTCTNYLPFGDGATCTGTIQTWNQPQFTGQWQDLETGLDHMAKRYYSAVEGRWTTPDPAGLAAVDTSSPQSWNRYSYVSDNPVSETDPMGTGFTCPPSACPVGFSDDSGSGGGHEGSDWSLPPWGTVGLDEFDLAHIALGLPTGTYTIADYAPFALQFGTNTFSSVEEYAAWQTSMSGIPYRAKINPGFVDSNISLTFQGLKWEFVVVDSQGKPVKHASAWSWETLQSLYSSGTGDPKPSAPHPLINYPVFHDWIGVAAPPGQEFTSDTNLSFVNIQHHFVAQGGVVYDFGPFIQVMVVENGILTWAMPIDLQQLNSLGVFPAPH